MEKLIEKADVLIEAIPYIRQFKGKIVIIKFGGSPMTSDEITEGVLEDVIFLSSVGIKPVLVHGGGHLISKGLRKKGKITKFIDGYRVTDKEALEVVIEVLANVNKQIVTTLDKFGGRGVGFLPTANKVIKAKKHQPKKGDLGYVGDVVEILTEPVMELISKDIIPVITPIGFDDQGNFYNINADQVAAHVAAALGAEKMVFLTNVHGIMTNKDDKESVITTLKEEEAEDLIKRKVIQEGMIPKVRAGFIALDQGVKKVHIIDGKVDHSLLLEIFTKQGIGTEIVK